MRIWTAKSLRFRCCYIVHNCILNESALKYATPGDSLAFAISALGYNFSLLWGFNKKTRKIGWFSICCQSKRFRVNFNNLQHLKNINDDAYCAIWVECQLLLTNAQCQLYNYEGDCCTVHIGCLIVCRYLFHIENSQIGHTSLLFCDLIND